MNFSFPRLIPVLAFLQLFCFQVFGQTLNNSRYSHSATLLNNGQVLIAGGTSCDPSGVCTYVGSAEIFNPATSSFALSGSLATPRTAPAVLLPNGKVLIAGGFSCDSSGTCQSLASAEVFDPATGTFSSTGNLQQARSGHTLTLLNDGRVLAAGGQTCDTTGYCYSAYSAEVYDPQAGSFNTTSWMNYGRSGASAAVLNDGRVLFVGGFDGYSYATTSDIYDPSVDSFTYFNLPTMNMARAGASATVLNNGQVLIAGGTTCAPAQCPTVAAEIYDPASNAFMLAANMNVAHSAHSATLLTNGQVLISGGYTDCSAACVATQSDELFEPATSSFTSSATLQTARAFAGTALLRDQTVFVSGGVGAGPSLATAEIYQPSDFNIPGLVSIAITPSQVSLIAGEAQRLVATGTFADGSSQTLSSASWTSADDSVASISNAQGNSGFLLTNNAGTTSVTASVGSVSGSATVSAIAITSLTITPSSFTMPVASTQQFTVLAAFSDGTSRDFTASAAWNSSTPSVVSISNGSGVEGMAQSISSGVATISASAGNVSASVTITVPGLPDPSVITSVTPNTAPAGSQISIQGTGFGSSPGTIILGSLPGTVITWTDTQIIAAVPQGSSSGSAQVLQFGIGSNTIPFTVITPVISSVTPAVGSVGTQVVIQGSGFGSAQTGSLTIGNAVASTSLWTDSQIVANVPANATTGNLLVGQSGDWSDPVGFTVNNISIASVTPQSGVAGTIVTITGSGFGDTQGAGFVWLGNAYGNVVSWSNTQVVASVAPGALSGSAQILQCGVWSSAVPFTVNTPQVAWIDPQTAPLGSTVTINGSGFGNAPGNGKVWLGNTYATVQTWSDQQITAIVAATARNGVAKIQQDGTWSNSVQITIPIPLGNPGIAIEPSLLSMVVGETHDLQAVLPSGDPALGLTWQVSDTTIATLSTDDPPTLTALLPGHVTLTAGDASADITVYPGPTLPLGTVKWSTPGDGSGVTQILPAVPSDTGAADVFAVQASGVVQAITADGKRAWTANVGTDPNLKLLPDFQGGLITVTPQSVMSLDGMTGQPKGLYPLNSPSPYGSPSTVPHTDGTIFLIDGDSLVGINPADASKKFSIAMEHSTTDYTFIFDGFGGFCLSFQGGGTHQHGDSLPTMGNLIIAGDGYAYLTYLYTVNTFSGSCIVQSTHKEQHLRVLRVSSSGDATKVVIGDWQFDSHGSYPIPGTPVGWKSGAIPDVFTADLITNADQGVVLSWQTRLENDSCQHWDVLECARYTIAYKLTPITGGQAGSDVVMNLPGQASYVQPILQSSDGTYYGIVSIYQNPGLFSLNFGGQWDMNMIAFDMTGKSKWMKQGYQPSIATADGGLIATSSAGSVSGFDAEGNATSQSSSLPSVSWKGTYNVGSIEAVNYPIKEIAGSFAAFVGGSPAATRTYHGTRKFKLYWLNTADKTSVPVEFIFYSNYPGTAADNPTDITQVNPDWIPIIKKTALDALRRDFRTFPVFVCDADTCFSPQLAQPISSADASAEFGSDTVYVVGDHKHECGDTGFFSTRVSTVVYRGNLEYAQKDLSLGVLSLDLIKAVGEGIGNNAAHEIAHQLGVGSPPMDITATGILNGGSCSDRTVFTGIVNNVGNHPTYIWWDAATSKILDIVLNSDPR